MTRLDTPLTSFDQTVFGLNSQLHLKIKSPKRVHASIPYSQIHSMDGIVGLSRIAVPAKCTNEFLQNLA